MNRTDCPSRGSCLRSPYDKIGGLVYFARLLDRVRSLARGEVPSECIENFEKDFDQECATFLRVTYELLVKYVNEGLSPRDFAVVFRDETTDPLKVRFTCGNEFVRKRGWNDEL